MSESYESAHGITLHYEELEDCGCTCKHCGVKILAQDCGFGNYLGENVSFFCDPNDLSKAHEPRSI